MTQNNLLYSKSHEWVRDLPDGTVEVGLTDHAQAALGDLVFVNLPQVGDEAAMGEVIADVESVKAVSDVYSPITGTVSAINEALLDSPELINQDAYGAWLFRAAQVSAREELLDAAAYEAFCATED